MGNLPVVIMPAICDEKKGPFGSRDECHTRALAYASFSLALGGIFIWTFTYQLVLDRSLRYKAFEAAEILKIPNKVLDSNAETLLLKGNDNEKAMIFMRQTNDIGDTENQIVRLHTKY
ncbi:hypothetical protein Lalb_Chr05g0229561 [Lupinus albus]|uniref:Uncharacterized protein n=1 Tax=Lupinus albus TaxID=3870 RepID=A0A6A4QK60_LUPAL|nr:hypothetical protein Lalb_Chr05g0229561 [Lupinus albus]